MINNLNLKLILLAIFNISFLFCSCKQNDIIEIKPTTLFADDSINEISDSIFVHNIQDIKHNDKMLFFSEVQNHRVICVDMDFNLKGVMGQPGMGPGDLLNPCGIVIDDSVLWIYSVGTSRINQYNINTFEFLDAISLEERINPDNYIILDDMIIGSNGLNKSPIGFFNRYGKLIANIGTNKQKLILNENRPRNFLFESTENHDRFLAICLSEPIIEMYNISGDLIIQNDFSNIKILDELIQFNINKKTLANSSYTTYGYLTDSYYTNRTLYLLVYSIDMAGDKTSNTIITFKISDKKIVPLNKFILNPDKETWYTAFTITSNLIIAYDAINYEFDLFRF